MKRRKIIGLIACIVLIVCLTGCAELDSALNDLQGDLTGNTYTINTYDNYEDNDDTGRKDQYRRE